MPDEPPDPTTDPVRIVVGVDGSETSRLALRRAAVEAAAHGAVLEVVHAWNYLDQHGPQFDPHYGVDKARANADQIVTDVLGADRPDDVVISVVNDHAVPALLGAASGALDAGRGGSGVGWLQEPHAGLASATTSCSTAPCSVLVVR